MKQLLAFIQKEFHHVLRDRRTLLILFGLPVMLIILFGFALNSEVKNIGITVLDNAHDNTAAQIVHRIQTSEYFHVEASVRNYGEIETLFRQGKIKCALIFPANFAEDLGRSRKATVQIIADAADPNSATILVNYLRNIIGGYQRELNVGIRPGVQIIPEVRQLYNEEQNGSLNFIPGVIALIFMIVCTTLTSVSVVREKELGTMEILLVSPFKPIMVLVAKAVPYLILSIINFIIILTLSVYLLHVEIKGSLLLLFLESILFIVACLSLGLVVSNLTNSQQTAMLVSMMGMMLPTIILTGFMFPLENMPWIFQAISHVLPSRYYYIIIKAVMLKGLGFNYIWKETVILAGMTVFLLVVALKNFKTRLS
ncbi:MAG TPA: ABC transporter permease [Phnomibacter sp.]|nr:ABC transporter permease [Phnomibacter sp.]